MCNDVPTNIYKKKKEKKKIDFGHNNINKPVDYELDNNRRFVIPSLRVRILYGRRLLCISNVHNITTMFPVRRKK